MANPPPVIQSGLALVNQRLQLTTGTHVAEVTFALASNDGITPTIAQDVIDDFQANFNAHVAIDIDSNVTVLPPTLNLGVGTTIPLQAVAAGAGIAGGSVGTRLPPNVAGLVKKTTGIAGKANRGRTYYPFLLTQAHVDEAGNIDAADVAALQVDFDAFLAQLTTDNTPMVIANKVFNTPHAPHHVTAINVGPVVTAYKLESVIATQRRRIGR